MNLVFHDAYRLARSHEMISRPAALQMRSRFPEGVLVILDSHFPPCHHAHCLISLRHCLVIHLVIILVIQLCKESNPHHQVLNRIYFMSFKLYTNTVLSSVTSQSLFAIRHHSIMQDNHSTRLLRLRLRFHTRTIFGKLAFS